MKKMIEKLMEHAEECLTECSKKQDWHDEDVECAYKAAKLYKTLQEIKMNSGIWEEMQGDGGTSEARMPRVYYGDEHSQMRGRDAATGRYMSRYYDENRHGISNRGGSRSMHSIKDRAIDSLERMYDTAQTDHERSEVDKFIRLIDQAQM